jgi:hypothetical protein
MRTLTCVSLLVLTSVIEACSSGTAPAPQSTLTASSSSSRDQVALGALDKLARFTRKGKASGLGFVAPQELEGASIGSGIPMYRLDEKALASFSPDADPHGVLLEQQTAFYPVMAKSPTGTGAATSAVVSPGPDGSWVISEIGRTRLARAVEQVERATVARRGATTFALVEIPSKSVRLLAYDDGGRLWLTPLGNIRGTSLVEGQAVDAVLALGELASLTKSM